jgi:hypothetical protein
MDWATKLGLFLALAGFGVSVIALFAPYEWKAVPRWLRRVGLAVGLASVLASAAVLLLVPAPATPEVTAKFIGAETPALVLLNPSDAVARDIKYSVVLWNLNKPTEQSPLLIPIMKFDFIRPHEDGGPEKLFYPNVTSTLADGDVLFGYASVTCPDCARWHWFLLYLVWHRGGWFYELPQGQSPNLLNIISGLPELSKNPSVALGLLPEASREKIVDVGH